MRRAADPGGVRPLRPREHAPLSLGAMADADVLRLAVALYGSAYARSQTPAQQRALLGGEPTGSPSPPRGATGVDSATAARATSAAAASAAAASAARLSRERLTTPALHAVARSYFGEEVALPPTRYGLLALLDSPVVPRPALASPADAAAAEQLAMPALRSMERSRLDHNGPLAMLNEPAALEKLAVPALQSMARVRLGKGASVPTTRKGLLAVLKKPLAAPAAPARPAAAPVAEVPWSAFTHSQLRGVLVGAGEPLPLGRVDKAHLAKLVRDAAARKQFGICAVASSGFQQLSTPQLVTQLAPLGDGARGRAALLARLTAICKATRGATAG